MPSKYNNYKHGKDFADHARDHGAETVGQWDKDGHMLYTRVKDGKSAIWPNRDLAPNTRINLFRVFRFLGLMVLGLILALLGFSVQFGGLAGLVVK